MDHERIDYLDGLRGLACLQVLLLHVGAAYFPEMLFGKPGTPGFEIQHSPLFFLYNGWVAVYLFFVLSGYVLTKSYAMPGDPIKRIEARVVRLWIPAVGFGVFALAMYLVFPKEHLWLAEINHSQLLKIWNVPEEARKIMLDLFVYPIFTGYTNGLIPTMIPLTEQFFPSSAIALNGPVWSLSVELVGSLLVMWLTFTRRNHSSLWAVSMIVTVLASPMLACFVFGHLAAVGDLAGVRRDMFNGWTAAVVKLLIFALGVYLARDPGKPFPMAAGAFLIFTASVQSRSFRRLLSSSVCLEIGRRSVTIYLMHWAVIFGFGSWVLLSMDQIIPWQTFRLILAPTLVFVIIAASGPLNAIDKLAIAASRKIGRKETDMLEIARSFAAYARRKIGFTAI